VLNGKGDNVKRPFPRLTFAVCACVCFALSSCGAPPGESESAADETATAGPEKSQAEAVLRQMADYLGELPSFSCRVDSSMRVQAQGMDNRLATKMAARLERPNRIAVIVEEGMMGATIVSDG
jgi:hypothetical protein